MRSKTVTLSAALTALVLAAPAGASVSGFRLPGGTTQQTPPPDLQGPVAPDVPASRRAPAPTPAPTPTPSASQTAVNTPTPVVVPSAAPRAVASPSARTTLPARSAAQPAVQGVAAEPALALPAPTTTPTVGAPVRASAPPSTVARPDAEGDDGWSWLWLLGAVPLALAALVLAGWGARRWAQRSVGPVKAPEIERPRVGPVPAAPGEPLQVSLEPLRLSLTLMNATLAYRLELANHSDRVLTGLTIGADMISAHASLSREEQLAGPRDGTGQVKRIERLEPGESRVVEGEFRLPFPQIVPIRQGEAALLLPLARFRVEADGSAPVVRTFVVGQPGQGSALQPFRLDQGPRVYPRLAQHAFA